MSRTRREWEDFLRQKRSKMHPQDLILQKTKRVAREKNALAVKRMQPLQVMTQEVDGVVHYMTNNGGHLIVGEGFITVKMPYGASANHIWRASIDQNGIQRNSLSESARHYKRNVRNIYEPLLEKIDFAKIGHLCEIRLIAQPPLKTRHYSARTYPRYDIDNYPKLIIDSLKGLLFKDDNIFIQEQIRLAKPVEDGCVWVSCVMKGMKNWIDEPVDFAWLSGE